MKTMKELKESSKLAIATVFAKIKKFFSPTKKSVASHVESLTSVIKNAATIVKGVGKAGLAVKAAIVVATVCVFGYTQAVAVFYGAIQLVVDVIIKVCRWATKASSVPVTAGYVVVNRVKKLFTNKDIPSVDAKDIPSVDEGEKTYVFYDRIDAFYNRINAKTDYALEVAVRIHMDPVNKFFLFITSVMFLFPALLFILVTGVINLAVVVSLICFVVLVVELVVLSLMNKESLFSEDPMTVKELFAEMARVSKAGIVSALAWVKKSFVSVKTTLFTSSKTIIKNLKAEIESLQAQLATLREELADAVSAAYGFEKAYNMSVRPNKKKDAPRVKRGSGNPAVRNPQG